MPRTSTSAKAPRAPMGQARLQFQLGKDSLKGAPAPTVHYLSQILQTKFAVGAMQF